MVSVGLLSRILKTTGSVIFGGAPGSPSNGTSPEALSCFGIWVRSNGADVLDFDFLLNVPCSSTCYFFITRIENVKRTL